MLLVFPVTKADAHLADLLAGHLLRLEGVSRHKLLVVGTVKTASDAAAFADALSPLFAQVSVFVPDTECEKGWPHSANHLWSRTVRYLQLAKNKDPWYWFEADNTPLRPSWLDEVETEYNQSGKPFLGAVQTTRLVEAKTGEFVRADGEHVIGSCVYPGNYPDRSALWKYVRWDDGQGVEPFDVYLRHEMRPHAAVSKLIVNHWRTQNYEIDKAGNIYCDPIDSKSVFGPVSVDKAAVIHGCKDGSLIEALT